MEAQPPSKKIRLNPDPGPAECEEGIRKAKNSWVIKTIRNINPKYGLHCDKLREKVTEEGRKELLENPEVFVEMLIKAVEDPSSYNTEVLRKLAETYRELPNKPQTGPLERLMSYYNDDRSFMPLLPYRASILPLIEILLTLDGSKDARKICLRAHVMNLDYIPRDSDQQLQWTDYVRILKILLEKGADPTWIPEGSSSSTLYEFFQRIARIVIMKDDALQTILELLPLFLTENSIKHKESRGSVLHALVNLDWITIGKNIKTYQQIVSEVVKFNPMWITVSDNEGICPLHCFVKGRALYQLLAVSIGGPAISDSNLQDVCTILKILSSDHTINKQDSNGQTIIHYLVDIFLAYTCMSNYPYQVHNIFLELVKSLVSPQNVNMQDKNGETVLHILARKVFHYPHLANDLLSFFQLLTSEENVNANDNEFVTPYSWIIRAKYLHNHEAFGNIYTYIENVFLEKGASLECGRNDIPFLQYCELYTILRGTIAPGHLDHSVDKILNLLHENGSSFIQRNETVLLDIIKLANQLMESSHYIKVVEVMVDLYKTVRGIKTQGALETLLNYVNDAYKTTLVGYPLDDPSHGLECKPFTEVNQKNLLTLLQMVMSVDSDNQLQSRTKCLRVLIMNAKYTCSQGRAGWICWSQDFIKFLKDLLMAGADATWIPEGSEESSFYKFFQAIFNVLANEPQMKDSLLELLSIPQDNQLQSRTKCLRVLIMNAKYTCSQGRAGWICWSQDFIKFLKDLLMAGADATWIPEGSEESSFYKFFQAIFNVLANEPQMKDSLLELLSMLLNEQSVKHEECQGNIVHALVEGVLEWLPDQLPQQHFKQIVAKITELNPAALDVVNIDGRTPLQCLLYAIIECKSLLKNVGDIIKILKTETNINIQDRLGRNALHWLMEILPFYPDYDVSQNHQAFCHLVSQIKTSENVDAQDQDRHTPLHTVARAVCLFPNTAYNLQDTISTVATSSNVNAADIECVTPYSWILCRQLICDKQGRAQREVFANINQIFLRNQADAATAQDGVDFVQGSELENEIDEPETTLVAGNPSIASNLPAQLQHGIGIYREDRGIQITEMNQLAATIEKLSTAEDLDILGQKVYQMLLYDGHKIMRKEPQNLIEMAEKAKNLMASRYYLQIVKIMANIYKTVHYNPETGPLDTIENQMHPLIGSNALLFSQLDRFLPLVQILTITEPSLQSRTKCLTALIDNFEYISIQHYSLQCTSEFLFTLKFLLEKGADPISISDQGSSRYKFFRTFNCILANQGHLFNQLLDLIPLFFTEKSLGANRETMLHGLVSCKWLQITRHLTEEFFQRFKQIVIRVINMDPSATDAINKGKNPLQCFLSEVRAQFQNVSHMIDIAKLLKTETNVDVQDNEGRTALHHLCQALSLETYQDVSQNQHEMMLSLIKLIKSGNNVNIQDKRGQTPLHIVAEETFLSTNPAFEVCSIFELLATEETVNIKDKPSVKGNYIFSILSEIENNDGITPYSWILRGKMIHKQINAAAMAVFLRIEEIFERHKGSVQDEVEFGPTLLLWITNRLNVQSCTLGKLKAIKTLMETRQDWFFHSDKWSNTIFPHMIHAKSPKFIEITKDILTTLLSKGCSCASNHILSKLSAGRTGICMEILHHCIKQGAKLTQYDLDSLLKERERITNNGENYVAFLEILAILSNEKALNFDGSQKSKMLDILTYCYFFCDKLRQSAMEFVQNVYESEEVQFKSLLFIQHKSRNYTEPDNTLRRSPLHLAVIFLNDKITLKTLSHDVVTQNIHAKDLHGCTPLHLAYLHHNKQAIHFLIEHGAENDVVDNFGVTPEDLGARVGVMSTNGILETVHCWCEENSAGVDHVDVLHHNLCCSIMKCHSDVLLEIRPMLLVSEKEAEKLSQELKLLFERLIDETEFGHAEIFIGGSMREKLKVLRVDEVDVQIKFSGTAWPFSEEVHVDKSAKHQDWPTKWNEDFRVTLTSHLLSRMGQIDWEGIQLRPTYFTWENPWIFLREGNGPFSGAEISVDVVFVLLHEAQEDEVLVQQLGDILEDAPLHYRRSYAPLKPVNEAAEFKESTFALEWDIIDSLPTSHRLALAISKSFVQAYHWNSMQRTKMPITSYVLKTTLFFILVGKSEDAMISMALKYALESGNQCTETEQIDIMKLKFNPKPRWITDEDVDQYAEDARMTARKIFKFIHYLAKHNRKVISYWRKPKINDQQLMIESEHVCDICEVLLDRLDTKAFYK